MKDLKDIFADAKNAAKVLAGVEREPANLPAGYVSPLVGDPNAIKWYRARRAMSFFAWDIYAGAAIQHYRATQPQSGVPLINSQGAFIGNLALELADRLEGEFLRCKEVPWRDQRPDGYSFDPLDQPWSTPAYRDQRMTHREMSIGMENVLNETLAAIAPSVEAALGHHWSAGAARLYAQNPGQDGGVHTDWWPLSLRKLMLYPSGAGVEQGSTVMVINDVGQIVTGGKGVWTIFENSTLSHMAAAPKAGQPPRPTVEITIMPAFRSDPKIKAHGINVGFPWLPPDIEGLEGKNVPNGFVSEDIKHRSLLRCLMLALDLPDEAAIPEHYKGLGYLDI